MSPEYMQALIAGASAPQQPKARMENGGYVLDGPQGKKKKSFLLDQISTGLGIAGGIAGSFVAPVAGTAGGAAAGSALGEAIENLISGESVGKNVAKEGLIGGVLGAGPIKLAKGVVGGAKAMKAGQPVIQGASQAALTPLRQKAGQKLTGAADDLAVKQFRLTPTQLKNYNQKFKEDAGTTIRNYGFQSADDIAIKGIEPLQAQFDEAIGSITGVTKESLKTALNKRISTLSKSGPSDTQALGGSLKKEANQLLKGYGDVIDANELNQIRRQFDSLVNYGEKVANPARYGVNKRMADAIRETLQKADSTGNLKSVGRELQKLRQLEDNALKQSQLGRGSLPVGINTLPGIVTGTVAGGVPGAVVGYAANQLVNSNVGRRGLMRSAERVGSRLTSSGIKNTGQSKRGIGTRVGAGGVLTSLSNQQPPSLENTLTPYSSEGNIDPITAMTNIATNMPNNVQNIDPQYQTDQNMSSPISFEDALLAMQEDLANTGGKNIDKIEKIYKFASSGNGAGGTGKPLSAEASKVLSNAEIGLQAINDFESAINQDPSVLTKRVIPGRNALGGALGGVLGTRGIDASAQQIIDVIARLRTGAAITNDEARRFEQFIPTAGDSPEVRQQKLGYLRNQFQMVASRSTTGGSDLESAVLQYAQ